MHTKHHHSNDDMNKQHQSTTNTRARATPVKVLTEVRTLCNQKHVIHPNLKSVPL